MPRWGGRGRRVIVVALASLLSGSAMVGAGIWVARTAGAVAGRALADATDDLAEIAPDEADDVGPSIAELAELSGASPVEVPRGTVERVAMSPAPAPAPRGKKAAPTAAPVLGILVRASVVRAAIARGGRPRGAPLAAEGERPAGLVLSGVSSYGSALRDGDVLTRVGGTPAISEGRVIAAVTGAVRSRAPAIDGEIWRAGRRIPVVVEIPRGKKRRR